MEVLLEMVDAVGSAPRLYHSIAQAECHIKSMTARVLLKTKICGHESQGAWHQDELIVGKPPVVK
jgi:hypothetical protein